MTAPVILALLGIGISIVVLLVAFARRRAERRILSLLSDGEERRGLDLVRQSGGCLKRGTIYVHLASMEERGQIVSRRDPLAGFPGIRLYRLAPCGDSGVA